jgi:hypothetical protein
MLGRFIAWWIRNAVYIAPVASSFSALAALVSVLIVAKTFRQNQRDKKEELEVKHPRFRLVSQSVSCVSEVNEDHTINAFYQLVLSFENQNSNPARLVTIRGRIFGPKPSVFRKRPSEEFYEGDAVTCTIDLPDLIRSDKRYLLNVDLMYVDVRTGNSHVQSFWRQFYYQGEEERKTLALLDVDRSDVQMMEQNPSFDKLREPDLQMHVLDRMD